MQHTGGIKPMTNTEKAFLRIFNAKNQAEIWAVIDETAVNSDGISEEDFTKLVKFAKFSEKTLLKSNG